LSIPFIDLKSQYLDLKSAIDSRISEVLSHGQYIMGPEVVELEQRLADETGSKYCITVSSGTDALLIALMALDIGPGDEVITTPFTFVSTAEVILMLGAKPIFVDVEVDTCNLNVSLLEEKISERTKAIIPVNLYGQPVDYNELHALAHKYGDIPIVEDAAQSFGAEYFGRKSGSLGTIGCTSFFPSKPLGCYGDGGAIFTDEQGIAEICRKIRIHGQSQRYVHERLGIAGRMDTLQCAIVLAKIDHFGWELRQRSIIGERYDYMIDELGIARVQQRADRTSVFAQYTIFIDDRESVADYLLSEDIPTAVHYPVPLNEQSFYSERSGGGSTPVASELASRVISLPMSPYLSRSDQDRVAGSLSTYLSTKRKMN